MIIETIRYVAATLSDATIGINAKLAAIGLDGTDTRPADIASINNEFDNAFVARRDVTAETTPLLMVFQPREAELEGWITTEKMDARDLPVAVVVVARDVDTEQVNLASAYYVRCIQQSINSVAEGAASRTRNNIQILNWGDMIPILPYVPVGDAVMTRGLFLSFRVRDLDPT
jgi:hypothetical protein